MPLSGYYFSSLRILTKTRLRESRHPAFPQPCCRSSLYFLEASETVVYRAPPGLWAVFWELLLQSHPHMPELRLHFPGLHECKAFQKTRRSCQFVGQIGYALEFMPYGTSTLHRILKADGLELAAEFWHARCYLNSPDSWRCRYVTVKPSARHVYLAGKMLSVPLLFYYPERFSCLFVNQLKWTQLLRYLERQGKWGAGVRIAAFSTWGSGCWEGRARVRIVAFLTWGSGCWEGRPVSFKILAWFWRNVKATQTLTQFIVFMKLTLGPAPVDFKRGTKCPIFTRDRADIIRHADTWTYILSSRRALSWNVWRSITWTSIWILLYVETNQY